MAVLAAVVRGIRAPLQHHARQLLARPLPLARLHPAAAVDRARGHPDLAGRRRRRSPVTRPRTTLEGAQQTIARGPAASQIAIKQLGTNGGGFYNSNSAVPFENPNGLTNFLEMLSILLIPAAQVFMFGKMVNARRHAWMVFAAMFVVLRHRRRGQPAARAARLAGAARLRREPQPDRPERRQHERQGGSLRSGQHRRSGRSATSDASNGSVNAGLDAETAGGGAVPLVNIFLGEVIFGGVGSGLYGMFFYILIAVFVAGLMVGRTPEYLGKKIEAREMKIAAVGALFVPTMVLTLTAIAVIVRRGAEVDLQLRRARLHRGALRLRLADEQQRQRVRRLRRDALLGQLGTVALYLGRFVPLIAALAHRRRAGRQEDAFRPRPARSGPTAATFVVPARRRDRPDGRPHDLPGPHPGADRRRTDAADARPRSLRRSRSSC